jgi:Transposase DDE domain
MLLIFDVTKLTELFIEIDDFCITLNQWQKVNALNLFQSQVNKSLTDSEIMTILILYQQSGFKNFQYFYERFALGALKPYFPNLVSYSRFVEYIPLVFWQQYYYAQFCCLKSARSGLYIVDSKKLEVCKLRKQKHHKVFGDLASKGKSSTGWFFGLKIHLIINDLGEIVNFLFTTGKVADNNKTVLCQLLNQLKGKCVGDRGYLTTLFDFFYEQGLHIVTKIRNNMKNKLMPLADRLLLQKRPVIEAIIDILSSVFDLEHTRHRSAKNAFVHMFSAISAYAFYEKKPNIYNKKSKKTMSLSKAA